MCAATAIGWDVLPVPSVDELRPNAGGGHGVWASAVKDIVDAGGDLTVLRGVGVDRRRKANKRGLFDWRDPQVTPESLGVKGAASAPVLKALLDVNRTPGPLVRPARVAAAPLGVDRHPADGVLRRFRDRK